MGANKLALSCLVTLPAASGLSRGSKALTSCSPWVCRLHNYEQNTPIKEMDDNGLWFHSENKSLAGSSREVLDN